MARSNPTWGAPRIHGELLKLGFEVSERTVSRLMPRRRPPSGQAWRTFLANHAGDVVAVDFAVVPTATFRMLYLFVVLHHDRRRVLHVNVTDHPTAEWTAQQVVEAFPWSDVPKYLLRDRDCIYGAAFRRRVRGLGLHELVCAPRAPKEKAHVERYIGTLRRELLDHIIVLNESHLRRLVREYVEYYNGSRTHLALAKDAPDGREVEPPEKGRIVETPVLGGLHHRYSRTAA